MVPTPYPPPLRANCLVQIKLDSTQPGASLGGVAAVAVVAVVGAGRGSVRGRSVDANYRVISFRLCGAPRSRARRGAQQSRDDEGREPPRPCRGPAAPPSYPRETHERRQVHEHPQVGTVPLLSEQGGRLGVIWLVWPRLPPRSTASPARA